MNDSNPALELPELLTAEEAAKYLRVSARTVYTITQPRGPLACFRIGGKGGRVLYSRAHLADFLKQAMTAPATTQEPKP